MRSVSVPFKAAETLIRSGAAYRCDCTPEMLEQERNEQTARKETPGYGGRCRNRNVPADTKHVVRLKIPADRRLTLHDAVKGPIVWDPIPLRDSIIMKSDGYPTYHLAAMVDDHDMQITHVARGEEWISTTPIHLLVYEAFGWQPPVFAHLPLVLGNDGKKLSKRHGATFLSAFREEGYLPDALLNYIVMIGWSPGEGEEQEIFSRQELIERFTFERVNKAGGVFDYDKLLWMNGVYIRALSDDDFIARAAPFIERAGLPLNQERLRLMAPHVKERTKLLNEVPEMVRFLLVDQIERDLPQMFKKGIDVPKAKEILRLAEERLTNVGTFGHDEIDREMRALAEELGLKPGPMFGVLRIAVTGKTVTPPLFESMTALGKDLTLRRLRETQEMI